MKVLVAIANYGTRNDGFLAQLLSEYRSMPYDVHVAVLTNLPKDLGSDIEVIVGLPGKDPWSLPFAHKKLFAERRNEYDLFIYSEDDTPLRNENIDAFLQVTALLPENEVAGFIRYEKDTQGKRYFSTIHHHFHWEPSSVHACGGETFAYFSNEHAACFVLTAAQLNKAIDSGGFLVEPHSSRYDLLCSAATDPYTQCGFRKVVCISRLNDFSIPHLPNKYIGKMGLPEDLLTLQVQKMLRPESIRQDIGFGAPLITRLHQGLWSKSYYEPASKELLDLVPESAGRVLSIGCGSGELEAALVKRGKHVAALPLDDVIGECAQAHGVEILATSFPQLATTLAGRRFDCLLVSNILHLMADPVTSLRTLARFSSEGGCIVVRVPNTEKLSARVRSRRDKGYRNLGDYAKVGLHRTGPERLRKWLREAGFQAITVQATSTKRTQLPLKLALGLADGLLGEELLAVAQLKLQPRKDAETLNHVGK